MQMLQPRFFASLPLPRDADLPIEITLDEKASTHIRVLRLDEADEIAIFDGAGGEFTASILTIGKREVRVRLRTHLLVERESSLQITLVQALATGDKMDWIIQKATELGVAAVQPIQTQRATAKLNAERAEKRAAHWQGVAIAACEQCGRNRVPMVLPLMEFSDWIVRRSDDTRERGLLLDPAASAPLTTRTDNHISPISPITLMIGPEGGFAPDEITAAIRHGIETVRFGPRVLRTETAGIAAIAALQAQFGDLA